VVAFYLVSRAIFPEALPGFAQHLLIVPLILFSTAVPLPFGALGVSEEVGKQLFRLVSHPSGSLAMMAFRVLMYVGGLVSAAVYLTHIKQVRALTETAAELEEELLEGELDSHESAGHDAGGPAGPEPGPRSDPHEDPLAVHPVGDQPEHGENRG
jgi:hypothetical protein